MRVGILAILTIVLLNGCATVNVGQTFDSVKRPNSNNVSVYIYRLEEKLIRKPTLIINGEEVADIPQNTFYHTYMPEGVHKIKAKWAWDVEVPPAEINIHTKNGETYFLRLWTSSKQEGVLFTGGTILPVLPDIKFYSGLEDIHEKIAINNLKQCKVILNSKKISNKSLKLGP